MRIGIIGSGLMGGKLGTIFARAGHDVVFSYSRSQRKLKRLAREAQGHARAGTPHEAAQHAEALLLAVHWSRVDAVLKQAGERHGAGRRPHVVGCRNVGEEGSQGPRRLRVQHSPE
jgi:predicted dinucleotide-binding enzyme